MQKYAREAYAAGIRYIGGCCGFEPYHVRALAEELAPERGFLPAGSDKHGLWGGGLEMHTKPWCRARYYRIMAPPHQISAWRKPARRFENGTAATIEIAAVLVDALFLAKRYWSMESNVDSTLMYCSIHQIKYRLCRSPTSRLCNFQRYKCQQYSNDKTCNVSVEYVLISSTSTDVLLFVVLWLRISRRVTFCYLGRPGTAIEYLG